MNFINLLCGPDNGRTCNNINELRSTNTNSLPDEQSSSDDVPNNGNNTDQSIKKPATIQLVITPDQGELIIPTSDWKAVFTDQYAGMNILRALLDQGAISYDLWLEYCQDINNSTLRSGAIGPDFRLGEVHIYVKGELDEYYDIYPGVYPADLDSDE